MADISFVDASKIIGMDGIHFNPKDYLEKYGWATCGEEAYALQIIIWGEVFSVHAAACEDGFLAWEVFDRNCVCVLYVPCGARTCYADSLTNRCLSRLLLKSLF